MRPGSAGVKGWSWEPKKPRAEAGGEGGRAKLAGRQALTPARARPGEWLAALGCQASPRAQPAGMRGRGRTVAAGLT